MATVRIELTAGDDQERRRRQQRTVKGLVILAGLIVLAFAAPDSTPPPPPSVRLAPLVTDFGRQTVGSPSARTITLHNGEETPFVVAGVMTEGVTQGDFSVDAAPCRRIAPGADCVAVVSFNPRAEGSQSATFRIVDAANSTSQTFVARGVAVAPVPPPPPPRAPEPAVVQAPPPPPPVRVVHNPPPQPAPTPAPVPAPAVEAPKLEELAPQEPEQIASAEPPKAPETTTAAAPPDNHTRNTLKKLGRIAGALIIGAVIAKQAQGHGDHSQPQQSDTKSDRRIQVSPPQLTINSDGGVATITNVGRDDVTITAISIDGEQAGAFQKGRSDCGTLAAGRSCTVSITLRTQKTSDKSGWMYMNLSNQSSSGVRATLVVNSNGGRGTVDLVGPNYKP